MNPSNVPTKRGCPRAGSIFSSRHLIRKALTAEFVKEMIARPNLEGEAAITRFTIDLVLPAP